MLQNLRQHYLDPIRSFNRAARLFLLMTIIEGIILSAWQLFFNFYMLESGATRDFLGLVNSMPSAAALIFGIPLGRLSDRIGRKPSLLLGLGLAILGMLAQITLRQPAVIVGAAFLTGVFNMLFIVSQAPLMIKLSNAENRTMLFSLNFGLQTIAGAVGSAFAGQLPAVFGRLLQVADHSASAYQAVLITAVLLGTTALIPLWLMEEAPVAPAVTPPGMTPAVPPRKSSGITARTVKMMLPNILIGFGAAILIPYMNVFFKDRFGISDALLGLLFSISALMIGVASLIAPRIAAGLGGKIRAVAATQSASLAFLLLMGFSPVLWLSSLGFLMRSALMNMSAPLYSAFCMEHTPEHQQGFVNSILNLSWNIGWAVGPYVSGVIQERYGFRPLFIATSTLYLLAVLLTWNFFIRTESHLEVESGAQPG